MTDVLQENTSVMPLEQGHSVSMLVADDPTSLAELVRSLRIIADRAEQSVQNAHQLNLAIGAFRTDVINPLREELRQFSYNVGDRMTGVTQNLELYVSKLDQILCSQLKANGMSDAEILAFRRDNGLQPEAPRGRELELHLMEIEELRRSNAALIEQNKRILAKYSTGHVFLQEEGSELRWHQGCHCSYCAQETERISQA